jgi:hypothetical protein
MNLLSTPTMKPVDSVVKPIGCGDRPPLSALESADLMALSRFSQLQLSPLVVAGDPNGTPPDSPSRRIDPNTATSPYAGVASVRVEIPGEGRYLGSGTAISRRHVLTAAHVLDPIGDDGVVDPSPQNVTVNFNIGGDLTQTISASELQIFPGSQGFSNSLDQDIALITLSQDLPDTVPIYRLNREPLPSGSIITMVGYGTSGDGVTGFLEDSASFSVKRVGVNQVEDLSLLSGFLNLDGAFLYDFDGPDDSSNLFSLLGSGTTLGNDQEAVLGPGDSGGPSFVTTDTGLALAGVNTFVFGLPEGFGLPGATQGKFGSGGGGVLLTADKLAWIDSIIGSQATTGQLQGSVWNDLNGDRQRTPDEPGLTNWSLYLDLNQNGQFDPNEPTTQTDASGSYTFADLAPGTYTVAQVLQPSWQQTTPTSATVTLLTADFSDTTGTADLDGFTLDNATEVTGAAVAGLWHLSTGRGNDEGHSADDSLYFGQGETEAGGGNYNVGHTAGQVTSGAIDLRGLATAQLSFNYFLRVETALESDQARVLISVDGGSFQTLASKGNGLIAGLNSIWRSASVDLTSYVGSSIQLRFDFDTVDASFNAFEGWYLDDIVVSGSGSPIHRVSLRAGQTLTGLNYGNQAIA